jgi:hypothetical protein
LGNDDGDFLIQTPTSAYSTKLIVKDNGNVGIGTTTITSGFILQNQGSAYFTQQVGVGTSAYTGIGGAGYLMLKNVLCFVPDNTANTNNRNWSVLTNGQFNGSLDFVTSANSASFPNDAYRVSFTRTGDIITNGNVGIGTTSFVYSSAGRGDIEVYGSTDALISLRNATANSYLQKSGNDFYFNNGGAGFISVTTNASERMRITSDGNVGIGTSSPGEKLGILNGNIQLLATSGDPYIRLTDNGVRNWYLKVVDTSDYFEVGGTTAKSLIVTGAGSVGIGDSAPSYKLDVSGSVRVYGQSGLTGGVILRSSSSTQGNIRPSVGNGTVLISDDSGGATRGLTVNNNGGVTISTANASQNIIEGQANGSQVMCLNYSGNIGLGTSSPNSKLEIYSTANEPAIRLTSTATATKTFGLMVNPSWAVGSFHIYDYTLDYSRLQVASNGNVGIGVGADSPDGKLSVIQSNTYSSFRSNGAGAYTYLSIGRTASEFEVGISGGSNQFFTGTAAGDSILKSLAGKLHLGYGSAAPSITIDSSNNVGIGIVVPSYRLHVVAASAIVSTNILRLDSGTTGFSGANDANTAFSIMFDGCAYKLSTSVTQRNGAEIQMLKFGSWNESAGGTGTRASLIFKTNNGTIDSPDLSERMRIQYDGNVGIGTTGPTARLHIRGGTELLNTSGSTSGTTSGSLMIVGQNTKGGANYHDFLYIKNSKATLNQNKFFRQDNTGNIEIINSNYGTNIFTLTDSGSLALPTAQSRNVTQLRNTGAGLKVGNYGLFFDDGNVHLHSTSPGTNLWLNCSGSGMLVVNGQTGATNGMCVGTSTQSGFVTIVGSKSVSIAQPYGYLNSSGAGSTTGTSPNPYSLTCDSRIMGNEFNAPSDERLKNIRGEISLDKAIDFVTKVDPIEFTWKEGVDTGLKAGYSAQQTYKAGFEHLIGVVPKQGIPEVVESDGFVSPKDAQFVMNYEQVTPYHSKLIKHLLDKIEQLESRISTLESNIK